MGTGHLAIPYQETGRRKSRQAASYNVGVFFFHAFGLFRADERFIIAGGVADPFAVFLTFSPLGIAVLSRAAGAQVFPLRVFLPVFVRQRQRRARPGCAERDRGEFVDLFRHKRPSFHRIQSVACHECSIPPRKGTRN